MGTFKPPYGSRLNRGHLNADKLASALLFNEKRGGYAHDLVRPAKYSLENGASWDAEGILFDASTEHIKAFNGSGLSGEGTIAFAYKYTTTPSAYFYFFTLDDDITEFSFLEISSYNIVQFNINGSSWEYYISLSIYDGATHSVLVTWSDSNNFRGIYVDGILINSTSDAFTWDAAGAANSNLRIGGRYTGINRFAGGVYNYFHVWNRVLALSEIQALNINPYAMFEDPYPIELFGYVPVGGETFYQNAGQGAVVSTGVLTKAVLFTQNTGGHAMTITGALTTIVTFVKTIGGHAMTIVGTLIKKTSTGVGAGQVSSTGILSKKTSKDVGGGSVTSIGTLTTAILFTQAVGGASMSIAGSLATQFIAGTGVAVRFIRRRKTFYKQ